MKAYRYRLYPNAEQQTRFAQHFGCARHVYNWALDEKRKHYEQTGKTLSKRAIQDQLVASKKHDKPWLNEVNSQSLLASLLHLHTAFKNFFEGRAQFPQFKSKHAGLQSFQCPQHVSVDFSASTISLPKIKGIKARLHRVFEGVVKTVTIKRTPSGKYFASVLVDNGVVDPIPSTVEPKLTVGLDLGLDHLLIDSEGGKAANPRHHKAALEQLAIEQKKLARKQPGSSSRAQQKRQVARVHERVANRRNNTIHELTAKLAYENQATSFAVEDLNIKGMLKNHKLARTIQDAAWGKFVEVLEYKCQWSGKNVLRIGRFQPSSKICNSCGYKAPTLPLSVRHWQCPDCGQDHDRDINAAKNIRDIALADALGSSVCVKSPPKAKPVSAGALARGVGVVQHGSQEAPTITAPAV